MGAIVSEYMLLPSSEMLIPIYQTTKYQIPYQLNADNTHGKGTIKSHILNIVSNALATFGEMQ